MVLAVFSTSDITISFASLLQTVLQRRLVCLFRANPTIPSPSLAPVSKRPVVGIYSQAYLQLGPGLEEHTESCMVFGDARWKRRDSQFYDHFGQFETTFLC